MRPWVNQWVRQSVTNNWWKVWLIEMLRILEYSNRRLCVVSKISVRQMGFLYFSLSLSISMQIFPVNLNKFENIIHIIMRRIHTIHYWKSNFPMNRSVRHIRRLVGLSVLYFPKGKEVSKLLSEHLLIHLIAVYLPRPTSWKYLLRNATDVIYWRLI